MYNFLRFCEAVIKRIRGAECLIHLMTSYESMEQKKEIEASIGEMKVSLQMHKIQLVLTFNDAMHDREIKLVCMNRQDTILLHKINLHYYILIALLQSNGWVIKIGRGLDFYTKPQSKFCAGFYDFDLRPCLETTIDIFQDNSR